MTNDYRKGWRYKLATDRNARYRRKPEVRARIEAFKERSTVRRCCFRSKGGCRGALQVHHVGGLRRRPVRLAWACAKHNQEAAGIKARSFRRPSP